MCTFIVMRSWDHIGGHIEHIVHYKQFSLLLCGGGFVMCDIFPPEYSSSNKSYIYKHFVLHSL